MSVLWAINGDPLANLGLEVVSVTFRAGAPGEVQLSRGSAFDEAPLFSYDEAVTLTRNGAAYFRGKVKSLPASASGPREGQAIAIADAWQDLEDTVYQESWSAGAGAVEYPVAILGIDDEGAAITTAEQIEAAIAYAAASGVDIQMGDIPAGLPLWPTEVQNTSCAEVIRLSLRFHPDWIPWLDHSTSPPTFNVVARADMPNRIISLTGASGAESFEIRRRDDLRPSAVRLTYLTASVIDGEVYRDGIIDKFPVDGPDSGPRVLSSVIELAGGQMQFQKSRIQTRTLPTSEAAAKTWLKLKFPHLAAVDDADMDITAFDLELVPDDEDHADPINPAATRLSVDDVGDLPRELVRGTIEDWMRKKVGKVRVSFTVEADGGAGAPAQDAIAKLPGGCTVTATNAVTKIYKGVTQWVAPEAAPEGVAESVYTSLEAYQYEGSVTLAAADVSAIVYHGCKLNLTGGTLAWASMNAMIHDVTVDIASGTLTLGFGPATFLAAADFLELQRLLRGRAPTWMSTEERTSNELGATSDPGSKGDTVSGYDIPETMPDPGGGTPAVPPDGWWGEAIIVYRPTSGPDEYIGFEFEAGILKTVSRETGVITGAEGAPGITTIYMVDT